jgi:hypothetical protein
MAKKNRSGSKKSSSGKADGQPTEHWTDQPQEHDYPAAASYLGLVDAVPSAAPPGQRGGRSASISSPGGSIAVN